jgi:hypothetical protein
MITLLALLAAATAQLTVGTVALKQSDYLDGRAIAGGTGSPVVMMTLTAAAKTRIDKAGPKPIFQLDGTATSARLVDNVIEIDGQPDFEAAKKLALALSGKPPLPDSMDE